MKLQIWDTAGGDQFRSLTPIYYKGAAAVVLCYDSTSSDSFESLSYWVDELSQKGSENEIIKVVAATKIDYVDASEVPIKQAKQYASQVDASFFQTSAKDGTGITGLFQAVAEKVYSNDVANGGGSGGGAPGSATTPHRGTVDLRTPTSATGMKKIPGADGKKEKKGCC